MAKTKPAKILAQSDCGECYTKRAANSTWTVEVRCALHPATPPAPEPPKKFFRVCWTEEYEEVLEAENEDQALEERTGDNAFQGCTESSAQEVEQCYKAAPGGRKECHGCDECQGGWRPVIEKQAA